MGLDMYLYQKFYIKNWDHTSEDLKHHITYEKGPYKEMFNGLEGLSYMTFEVAYWRKANAIHKWFVDNCADGVDDCREAYVSEEQLRTLLGEVEKVLEARHNGEESGALPPTSGFFFGDTNMDEYYYEDMEITKTVLTKLLTIPPGYDCVPGDFYYQASW
jgi:hypothetical protein